MRSLIFVLAFAFVFALVPAPVRSQSSRESTPTAYHLKINASDLGTSDTFSGSVLVNVTVGSSVLPSSLILNSVNLTIDKFSIVVMGKLMYSLRWQVQPISDISVNQTHLNISFSAPLASGDYSIYIEYKGYYQSTMAGFAKVGYHFKSQQKYLGVTGLEPTNARKVFPCYDEPGFKTQIILEITVNRPLAAVSNVRPSNVHNVTDTNKRVFLFNAYPTMPIYQLGWAVLDQGSYPVRENNSTSPVIHTRAPFLYMNQTIYPNQLTGHLVKAVGLYTGIEYNQTITQNYSKIEQIVLPEFFTGTSEGYGFMIFSEDLLLVSPNKSSTRSIQTTSLTLARSMIQQYFGDIICIDKWNNFWMMKGINEFLQYPIAGSLPEMSNWELEDQAVPELTQLALSYDSPNSHPLTFYTDDETELVNKVSDNLTKYKGGAIIRMLKDIFGSSFNEAMNMYFSTSFANPSLNPSSPQDFWNLLYGVAADKNIDLGNQALSQLMLQWTNAPGYPVLSVTTNSSHFIISQSNSSQWWVPVSYTLQDSPTDVNKTWLQPGSFFTVPALSATWILLNINQTGFYRVNYTGGLLQKLSTQLLTDLTQLPRLSRAQLIDDIFYLDPQMALDFTKCLRAETDYFPWATSLRHYQNLIYSMDGYSSAQLLKNYVLDLMNGVIAGVGFSPKPQDTHIDKLKRSLVLEKACEFGHPTCIQEAVTNLQMWIAQTFYDQDLSPALLCAGVANSSTEVWENVWSMYQYSIFPSVRLALLRSLTCTYNTSLLNQLLNNVTSTSEHVVSVKDKTIILQTLASKPFGAKVLLNWLVDRLQAQVNSTTPEASTPMTQGSTPNPTSTAIPNTTTSDKTTDQTIDTKLASSPTAITVMPVEKLLESDVTTILDLILPMLTTLDGGAKLDSFLTLGNETGLSNSTLETMKAATQKIYTQAGQTMELNGKLMIWLETEAATTSQTGESTKPSTQTEPPHTTPSPSGTSGLTSGATTFLLCLLALCQHIRTML